MRAIIATPMADEPLTLHWLPLFPLGTVLFPGGELPLRIFEVRYLDLMDKCQKAGAPFGVVNIRQGHEVQVAGAPDEQLQAEGTLAHIVKLERPQSGLFVVQCEGRQRFRVVRHERLKHGLWVADVVLLADDAAVSIPEDLQHTAQALRQLRNSLRERGAIASDDAESAYQDCGWVANRWCELLPLSTEMKQRLMTLDNPLLRLELVADILSREGI
ncbi:LON peptidase substrate-binding domain-containing protein [Ottowia thiooxydans]|uniref:LON peptidase substrate-binding domain-containing protein n=1 Tax=Ottowia thiooxydans TaxID=219182 RepID=UPI0005603E1D|nr:LON peptidase substrate-binding domain-containing protein [Ottowia thiooxydans]